MPADDDDLLWGRVGVRDVQVEAPVPAIAAMLRTVLADLLVTDPSRADGGHPATITIEPADPGYRVVHERGTATYASMAAVVDGVVSALNLVTLYHSPDHAHLHAAGVTDDAGQAVVLTAPSGSGKTTLTASLVAGGFGYLSDERIGIDATGLAHPYHKPLSIKRASWPLLPHLEPTDATDDHRIWQVPASSTRPTNDPRSVLGPPSPTALILQVRHEADAEPRFEPVSRAQTVAAMVLNSMDFDVIGPDTMVWFGRAAATARCGVLVSGTLPATVRLVRSLLVDPIEPAAEPQILALPAGPGPDDGHAEDIAESDVPRLRSGTTAVLVDGELVVHEPETRQTVVLNESASGMLAAMDGRRTWAELAATTETPRDAALALAVELGRRGLLDGVTRSIDPPSWHELTQAARRP